MNPLALFHVMWPYLLQLGGAAYAVFLGKKIHNAADSQRALALAAVAKDAAARIYANNPQLPWLQLVKDLVDELAGDTTPDFTTNRVVLERVAAGALTAVGAGPAPKK